MKLRGEGGIKALLGMIRCRHADVLAQVARGIANFAKCESRASTQGKNLVKIPSSCSCCCSACRDTQELSSLFVKICSKVFFRLFEKITVV